MRLAILLLVGAVSCGTAAPEPSLSPEEASIALEATEDVMEDVDAKCGGDGQDQGDENQGNHEEDESDEDPGSHNQEDDDEGDGDDCDCDCDCGGDDVVDVVDDVDADVDVTIDCKYGGTVRFEMQSTVERDPFVLDVHKRWTYVECAPKKKLKIDGTVTYNKHVTYDANNKLVVDVSYDGDLSYTGKVNGSCRMDVDYHAGAYDFRFDGHFCQHPAGWWKKLWRH